MIKLYNLIPDKIIKQQNISNISLCGISCDSRKIKKNYIFAALVGVSKNGLDYINEAINKLKPLLTTIHISGGDEMMKASLINRKHTKILGVSILTSLDNTQNKKY